MVALCALTLLFFIGWPASARAAEGPELEVDPSLLRAALSCPEGRSHPDRPIVLLVHGTGTKGAEMWPEGLGKSLPLIGRDWCLVQLPDRALGDIQTSSEYVVSAVRELHALTGGKVDLIGHSQGAVEIRWAVRFWPDVRAQVEDLVTLAGANGGVQTANSSCGSGYCALAIWQMRIGAKLEAALNGRPAPVGPSYTAVYSNTDELVRPASAGTFAGASNILVQDICAGRYVGHAYLPFDAAAVAATLDALQNPGPANPGRVSRAACGRLTGPGIDPASSMTATSTYGANALAAIMTHPTVPAEPPLRAYARGDAPASGPTPPPPAHTPASGPASPPPSTKPTGLPTHASRPDRGFRILRVKASRRGTVEVVVRVTSAGTLTVADAGRPGRRARLRRVTRRPQAPRVLSITLRPTAAGRRVLKRRGAFRARTRFTFRPRGATAVRRTLSIRFRQSGARN